MRNSPITLTNDPVASQIDEKLRVWAAAFDARIPELLPLTAAVPAALRDAVLYSLRLPGKRLRPFLVHHAYQIAGGDGNVDVLALAVECLHTFTLIHDDLPAMDNDEIRRGSPSNHIVHGEAMAVLAGDALLTLGLQLTADCGVDAERSLKLVKELCLAIGWSGVIAGQADDITGEQKPPEEALTHAIHIRKTARLFQSCCRVGAIAAAASEPDFNNLDTYGLNLGLAFQISDDLLDVAGELTMLGKHCGKDLRQSKQTYPRCVGIAGSQQVAQEAVDRACTALDSYGGEADVLRQLAEFVLKRAR